MGYTLVFDEVIIKQLKHAVKNQQIKNILQKILDKIEQDGPNAGRLIDSKLFLYEIKLMRPPIRLYFRHIKINNEIYIFEYQMKNSSEKQQDTINTIRKKVLKP